MTATVTDVELTDEVLATVADHAAASDASGHLAPEVVAALAGTGINRLYRPVELGGFSASPRRALDVVERISAMDGSTGWASAIGFGSQLFAGYLPRDGAAEVFADPDRPSCSMFAPLGSVVVDGDGVERLSGRWPFVSNCEQSDWISVAAMFDGDLAPRVVFVRSEQVTIHDGSWDVAGMRATGSSDVSLDGVVVDRRHTTCFTDRSWADGPLWRLPQFVALTPALAGVALGLARGALDEINRQAMARRAQMRGSLLDDLVGMADLGVADAELRGARAAYLEVLDECWALAEADEPISRSLQARHMLAAQHCADVAVDVCGTAHRLGGGAAAYRSSPLLRAVRDVETLRQHAIFNRGLKPHLARTMAGTEEAHPPFVL